jgi:MFS family permease
MLVPIRESGSLVPQVLIAGWVRRQAKRKWIWVAGSFVQAACVAGMGAAALWLEAITAGALIVALLAVFSLARSFCSIASKDVLGKTVPPKRRGRLTGWSASGAGLVAILVGLALLLPSTRFDDPRAYGGLLIAAGLLWITGGLVFSRISEDAGETSTERASLVNNLQRLSLLASDRHFRRFVVARAMLLCTALSAPYYVLIARSLIGDPPWLLGLFIIAGGLASLLSAPIWGRFADRSSRLVMSTAGLTSGIIGIAVFGVLEFAPTLADNRAFMPLAFFVVSIAHDGVRVGRKTYVVDLAEGNQRTEYVAVSNTVIGVILLIAGLSGTLSSVVNLSGVVLLLSVVGIVGAWISARLKEV